MLNVLRPKIEVRKFYCIDCQSDIRVLRNGANQTCVGQLLEPALGVDFVPAVMSPVSLPLPIWHSPVSGTGIGVIQDASNDETRPRAIDFFKRECVLVKLLSSTS
jgi:hypothetical protein